ncbi:hypothetical protein ABIE62_002948 [Porphyrobacter sp. MBR-155]|jgi:hypothetical protein|uniref:hypothetical protein n=1 Tax=Porphyrobacter sp. MBR-155 TaxID=3156464 RepID=UPI00339134EC
MTTIILTIIGILLAAAAALMVIFYGGDAFNSGTVGAQANQYQNAGTNVISAVQMFKAERATRPANINALTVAGPNGAYLDELPALPTGVAGVLATETVGTAPNVTTRDLYVVTGGGTPETQISSPVCDRINSNLRVTPATGAATVAAAQALAAAAGAPKMGCYTTTAGNVFIARA